MSNQRNNNNKNRNNRSNYKRKKPRNPDNKGRSRNPKKKSPPKNSRKRNLSLEEKYFVKFETYINARRDYYQSFRGTQSKRSRKLYQRYMEALKILNDFRVKFSEKPDPKLALKFDFYSKDLAYTTRNNLPEFFAGETESLSDDHIMSFHENELQKSRESFKDDTEDSVGEAEDYEKYKALASNY